MRDSGHEVSRFALARRRAALVPVAILLLAIVVGAGMLGYRLLDRSGAFAIDRVQVSGGDPATAVKVRKAALASVGTAGLLMTNAAAVEAAVESIPLVRAATVDRAFPSTLRVDVVPERAVAIAPDGEGYIVLAESGRVLGPATSATDTLPMVAAAPSDIPGLGGVVIAPAVLEELRLASHDAADFHFTAIGYGDDGLMARLARGPEIHIGDVRDLAKKLAIARSVLRRAGGRASYVDVTVPTAPVLRQLTPDARTVNAPVANPTPLPSSSDAVDWIAGAAPAESIRTLFG